MSAKLPRTAVFKNQNPIKNNSLPNRLPREVACFSPKVSIFKDLFLASRHKCLIFLLDTHFVIKNPYPFDLDTHPQKSTMKKQIRVSR